MNVFDLVGINGAGRYGTGGAADWSQGDFNYDGMTNVFDLVAVGGAAVYGQGGYLPAGSVAATMVVPEPAAAPLMSGIGVAAMLLVRRWRRSTWHGGRRP